MTFVIFVLVVLAFIPWLMYYSRSRILVIHSQFNSDCWSNLERVLLWKLKGAPGRAGSKDVTQRSGAVPQLFCWRGNCGRFRVTSNNTQWNTTQRPDSTDDNCYLSYSWKFLPNSARCHWFMAGAYQMEPPSPIQALGVNPFPSRFIIRTVPRGDFARRRWEEPITTTKWHCYCTSWNSRKSGADRPNKIIS